MHSGNIFLQNSDILNIDKCIHEANGRVDQIK